MTAALAQRRDELLRDLTTPGKMLPPLKVQDAALALDVSRRTVARLVDRRVLRKMNGRIPANLVRAQLA